jgi:hypothetical protein
MDGLMDGWMPSKAILPISISPTPCTITPINTTQVPHSIAVRLVGDIGAGYGCTFTVLPATQPHSHTALCTSVASGTTLTKRMQRGQGQPL